MKRLFIANPIAGRGRTRRVLGRLKEEVARLGPGAELVLTQAPGDATRLADDGVAAGFEQIVAVGGDGTAIEVATALFGQDVPMAVVPTGAGCDIVRGVGIPPDPLKALSLLADGLTPVWTDAGLCGDEVFLTVAGVGFDAEVAAEDRRSRIFGLTGTVPYVIAVMKVLARYRPTPMTLSMDGQMMSGKYLMVAVANGPCYAGGMHIAPQAQMDDGLFDVVTIGDLGRVETLRVFPSVYSGAHLKHPKVSVYRAREVSVEASPARTSHLGGEVGPQTPVTLRILPRAFRMLVPKA